MTEIELAEGNNLIMEFVGKLPTVIKEEQIDNVPVVRETKYYEMNGLLFKDSDLRYPFDFNWLAEVLKEIFRYESLKYTMRNELHAAWSEIDSVRTWRAIVWWLRKTRKERVESNIY